MAATLFRSPHLSSARFADKPEDFAKLGIQAGRIEAFEDGMRTEGGPGGYEWWYFDSHLYLWPKYASSSSVSAG